MKTIAEKQKWLSRDVKTQCNAEGNASAILLPVTEIEGVWYAYTKATVKGRHVGDNVCLTGGSRPFGNDRKDCVEVSYYYETFSAGFASGGTKGVFQIPRGEVELSRVTEFY